MKQISKFFALALIMIAFSAVTYAQVTATSGASATIITPMAISKTVDLNFGNVAVSTTAGTVVVTPAGARSATGGVTLPAASGTVTAASFNVTGAPGATYSITLPTAASTISNGTTTMAVDTWTSSPSPTGTLVGGTSTLTVGGTLHVAGSQQIGAYTNSTAFDVTVNYN